MLGRSLELDNNTGRDPRVVLSASEYSRVDPISLENTPVKRPDDFRIDATPHGDSEGVIGNAGDSRKGRARVHPAKEDMTEGRNTRRPRHLRPEQIVNRGRVGPVVT